MSKWSPLPNQFRVICTGRGKHRSRELAFFTAPGYLSRVPDGSGGMRTVTEYGRLVPATGRGRQTGPAEDDVRPVALGAVIAHPRADGGVTFDIPGCPTCRRGTIRLRDDTLKAWHLRNPGGVLDISLIRRA